MANIQFLNPDSLGTPLAPYSNVTRVKASEFLFIEIGRASCRERV